MKKITVLLSFFVVFSCLNTTPSNKIPESFDYGSVKNGIYKNAFFDMIVPFDEAWDVQSQEEFDALTEEGIEELMGRNESTKRNIEAAKITSANLFSVFKYTEADAIANEVVFNPSFLLIAENVKGVRQVRTATDYLDLSKKMLKEALMDYEFPEEYETKTINGVTFDVLKVKMNYLGSTIKQEMYATLMHDFCLFFTISYVNNINKEDLYNIIENIKFNTSKQGKPQA